MMSEQRDNKKKLMFDTMRGYIKPLLILFAIYLLASSSIINANFNYVDDMGRANTGYADWGDTMSRYASDYLSYVIHTDDILADIAPLTQYIALFIMALTAIIVIYLFQGNKKIGVWQIVSAVPLALSPYFLECISYKFDSPYMAISVIAGIAPLLLKHKNMFLYMAASIVGVLLVSMTYQAAWGIYPIMVIILATRDWNNKLPMKKILMFIGISAISFGIAIVAFKFLIMKTVDTYATSEMFPMNELFAGFMRNLKTYYTVILREFRPIWIILTAVVIAAYILTFMLQSKRNKIIAAFMAIASLAPMALLAFGMFPALARLPVMPRYMYGFCILTALLGIAVSTAPRMYIGKAACVMLSWCFIVLTFTYGNALDAQKEYTDYRISMIAESLSELECVKSKNPVYVEIAGSIGYAASVPDYDIIHRLVPVTLRERSYWGHYGLVYYYGLSNLRIPSPVTSPLEMTDPIRVVDTALYSIDVEGQNVRVTVR